MVQIDYKVKNTKRRGRHDLRRFRNQINQTFEWYTSAQVRDKYYSPCFPIVQSSGTGKTKIMHDTCTEPNQSGENKEWQGRLFTCVRTDSDIHVFLRISECESYPAVADILDAQLLSCNALLGRDWKEGDRVVFFFDEAQALLEKGAYPFRCIRNWLRVIRNPFVVAVFAGTTSRLANFYNELTSTGTSRDPLNVPHYKEKGKELYSPFFELFTVGLLDPPLSSNYQGFELARSYGRPLFSLLNGKELEEKEILILCRMLMVPNDPSKPVDLEDSSDAWMSILGLSSFF